METLRKLKKIRIFALLAVFMWLLFSVTSCMVLPPRGAGKPGRNGNSGKHKGWHKGKGNPHSQSSATSWKRVENSKE